MSESAAPKSYVPCLSVYGPGEQFFIRVPAKRESLIGRSRQCDVILTNEAVSRRHLRLVYENYFEPLSPPKCFVEDLGSKNGAYFNGDKLSGRREIRDRDLLRIGDMTLVFSVQQLPGNRSPETMSEVLSPASDALRWKVVEETWETRRSRPCEGGYEFTLTTPVLDKDKYAQLLEAEEVTCTAEVDAPEDDRTVRGTVSWIRVDNVRRNEGCTIGVRFAELPQVLKDRVSS